VANSPCSFPVGISQCSLYRGQGGPKSRSGRVRRTSPRTRFDPRTIQSVASVFTDFDMRFGGGGGCYLLSSLLLTRVTRCKPCIKQCPLFVHCLQVRLYGNWLGVKDKEGGKREQKRNKMSTKCHTNEYILRVQLPLKIQREVSSFVTEAVNLAFLFASHLPLLHLRPIYVFSKGRVALDTSIKCWANSYIV